MDEKETPEVETTRTEKVKNFIKENWKPIVGVVAAAGLKVTLAVLETRRENRKTEAYIDALEERTELQREALGLDLPMNDFTNPFEDDE